MSFIFENLNLSWVVDDESEEKDLNTHNGLLQLHNPLPFEKWTTEELKPCPLEIKVDDNRFRLYIHCMEPKWISQREQFDGRIDTINRTCLLEHSETISIDNAVTYMKEDTDPGNIDWSYLRSLSDLLTNIEFVPNKTHVRVHYESTIGKIIRKNKIIFKLLKRPENDFILIDKATLSAIIRGVAEKGLNEKLTSELRIIDLIAGNYF